jgi:hypothetical protein
LPTHWWEENSTRSFSLFGIFDSVFNKRKTQSSGGRTQKERNQKEEEVKKGIIYSLYFMLRNGQNKKVCLEKEREKAGNGKHF